MRERFGYDPAFEELADAIKSPVTRRRVEVGAGRPGQLDTRVRCALGNGPLHWAVITRQNDLVDIFVARGAGLEARRADGQTPLLVSLNGDYWFRSRDLPSEAPQDPWIVTRHLLACGAEYALSIACAAGDEERVEAKYWYPIRSRPARSMPAGAARLHMPRAKATLASSKDCWTWVPTPTSRKKTRRAAGHYSAPARATTLRRPSCCSNEVPIPMPRWTHPVPV